jgi:hypothetical protein
LLRYLFVKGKFSTIVIFFSMQIFLIEIQTIEKRIFIQSICVDVYLSYVYLSMAHVRNIPLKQIVRVSNLMPKNYLSLSIILTKHKKISTT